MNNPKILKIVILALFLLLIVGGISGWLYHARTQKELNTNDNKIIQQSNDRIAQYDNALRSSEQRRKAIQHNFDSVATRYRDLDRLHAVNVAQLSQIKGEFDKLNSNELAAKMTDEFNKRDK